MGRSLNLKHQKQEICYGGQHKISALLNLPSTFLKKTIPKGPLFGF